MRNNALNNKLRKETDVLVIGGGASGLMAAITAARNGAKTIILEHKEKSGKKLLSTGNGKCNYTNDEQGISNYRGDNPDFVVPIFEQFSKKDTISFFEEIGILPKIKNGYYYPASEQASAMLEVLHLEVNYLRVEEYLNCTIKEIRKKNKVYEIGTDFGTFVTKTLIFATGLLAAPKTGSDGSAFQYIEGFGHHFIDIVPALVPLQGKQAYFKSLAGIRADAVITLFVDNAQISRERGELQLTDYGVSGIPIFQLSRYATKALHKGQSVHVLMDFLPDYKTEEVVELLEKRFLKPNQKKTKVECLVGLFQRKLAEVLLKEAGISLDGAPAKVTTYELNNLAHHIKGLRAEIIKSKSYEQAQVCAGGVDTTEIYEQTLESKLSKGVYFAGEVIDIDGRCGGYNLQWAWSSGYVAGKHAAQAIER